MLQPATMAPAALTELAPEAATCRACGRALSPGNAVCTSCGAAHGETNRCPHCNAVADVEAHAALGFRCLVCGGPRVSLDIAGVAPSASTLTALRGAAKRHTEHVVYSGAGFVLSGMGALALLIATLVVLAASPGLVPTLAAYLGALVPTAAGWSPCRAPGPLASFAAKPCTQPRSARSRRASGDGRARRQARGRDHAADARARRAGSPRPASPRCSSKGPRPAYASPLLSDGAWRARPARTSPERGRWPRGRTVRGDTEI